MAEAGLGMLESEVKREATVGERSLSCLSKVQAQPVPAVKVAGGAKDDGCRPVAGEWGEKDEGAREARVVARIMGSGIGRMEILRLVQRGGASCFLLTALSLRSPTVRACTRERGDGYQGDGRNLIPMSVNGNAKRETVTSSLLPVHLSHRMGEVPSAAPVHHAFEQSMSSFHTHGMFDEEDSRAVIPKISSEFMITLMGKASNRHSQFAMPGRDPYGCSSHFHTGHLPHLYSPFTVIEMGDSINLAFMTVKRGEDDWSVGIGNMKLKPGAWCECANILELPEVGGERVGKGV
ncbi:hypothetical protein BT69DRAFT_1328033 [Atractiella rhizophila]|nr:hypothetical protein BT69DRAFT_1328033 [Atractiella rhizophila]